MAVVDRTVASVEVAVVRQQIPELCALVPLSAPRHLDARAGPVLLREDGPATLAERPVEVGVVRYNDGGIGGERLHGCIVDQA